MRPCSRRAEQRDHRRRGRNAAARCGNVRNGDRTGSAFAGRDDVDSSHVFADSYADADSDSDTNIYTDTDPGPESDRGSKPQS